MEMTTILTSNGWTTTSDVRHANFKTLTCGQTGENLKIELLISTK